MLWVDTKAIVAHLGISRAKMFDMKKRGFLKQGHHWTRKDPSRAKSDLLWHMDRIDSELGRG